MYSPEWLRAALNTVRRPEGDICIPGVLGSGRRVALWYHWRMVLGGPDAVQFRTKELPTSRDVDGEINRTIGMSGREGGREGGGRGGGRGREGNVMVS